MKTLVLFLSLFTVMFYPVDSFAQLTGTKAIPGDYPTIETAIVALNLQGVGSGGVTFNVASGHTETFSLSLVGTIIATGTQADQIIFQKSGGGTNPLITAALGGTGTTDGIIKITGGDYITFDGIDIQENSSNTNAITQMEWGYALVKRNASAPVDGCWNVTIKNATITLNRANTASVAIYSGNHLATSTSSLTLSDSLDVVAYCKFFNNTISNVYYGIKLRGWTNSSFYDQNNEVGVDGGNNISNYGGGSSSAYGMNIEYQNNLKVSNNIVNGNSAGQTGVLYGIRTGSGTNSNIDIYNNTVMNLTQGGTSLIYAITNSTGSSGTDNKVNIYSNTVENCLQPNSTSNSVWLIYNLASAYELNIYGNTIRNNTKSAGTGPMRCIYNSPISANVYENIYDNLIYNNSSNGLIYGIEIKKGTNTSIYRNQIYDLRTTSSTTHYASGITVSSGPTGVNIFNNFISDLKAINAGNDNAIRAINIISTTSNSNIGLYYNTIYLDAVSGGSNFGSSGIYHTYSSTATTATLDMRNNIVVNTSTPNGTGKTSAFRRSSATNLNNYSTDSDNNCFYAGTPSSSNVIFFDGTNFDQTLAEFKTRVAPREANSVTENVPFVNSSTPPFDLHVRTDVSTQIDSGGTPVTTPIVIADDFDGDTRNATTPDIGADEFDGAGSIVTFPLAVSVDDGWNMVSIPGLHPTNQDVTTWWSGLTGSVFKYSLGYLIVTTAAPSEGYWMKHSGAQTYNTGDEWPAGGINIVPNDPIGALTGWNLIGGYENTVLTSDLTTTPSGLIDGPIYEYSSGYQVATNLVPGYGYWIKLTGDGDINVPGPLAKGNSEVVEYFKDDWGKITITDNVGRSYTLYVVKGDSPDGAASVNLDNYELPPMPPVGMFDIRYGSGRIAEDINEAIQTIEMTGIEHPIKVKVENMEIRLQDESGKEINVELESGEEITISNKLINKLMVSGTGIGEVIPDEYALEQNYPNPFNPSTTIKFAVPKESNVNLSIYNVLGELVSTLVNKQKKPGFYEYKFNASTLASGVYLYRIKAGDFVETKKMILLR